MPGMYFSGIFVLALFLSFNGFSQSTEASRHIEQLLNEKSYFAARTAYAKEKHKLSPLKQLQFGAFLDNAFNKLESSNRQIEELQQHYKDELPDSVQFQLIELQQSNYAKLYDYRRASICIDEVLYHFPQLLTEEALGDFRNTQRVWAALSEAPPQQVTIPERTVLKLERDKAGLSNMDVQQDSVHIAFIFDTGANLSTVTETTAKRLHMELTDAEIEVNSITGLNVISKLAICPEFRLGGIVVKNAVFLVFPDSALEVPQIDYQINGIIGFPVIEAMKEIQLTKSGEFIVPVVRDNKTTSNMALDFLNPIIELGHEVYTFDSGANSTMLYKRYYDAHKKEIDKHYKEKALEYGGAGGNVTRQGYTITWTPEINGRKRKIKNVMVFKDTSHPHESAFYGNIGQDVIQQFDVMTLNFESMFIRFE